MSSPTRVSDALVLARRNLKRIPRQPDLLIAYTIQPVMFVLLFLYVFGGAIETPGFDYVDFLIPGIIVQSIAFGGFVTALGLSEDLQKGLIDRFRSLPMSRSAVLTGRTLSDVALNCLSLTVLLVVGLICGFNFQDTTVAEVVLGIVLLLLFGYAFSWVFALVGLFSSSPETANSIGFTAIFPLTFASSAFVPAESMPDGLQQFANANPFTTVVDAVRSLWLGTPANTDVWMAFVWWRCCSSCSCRCRSAGIGRSPPNRGLAHSQGAHSASRGGRRGGCGGGHARDGRSRAGARQGRGGRRLRRPRRVSAKHVSGGGSTTGAFPPSSRRASCSATASTASRRRPGRDRAGAGRGRRRRALRRRRHRLARLAHGQRHGVGREVPRHGARPGAGRGRHRFVSSTKTYSFDAGKAVVNKDGAGLTVTLTDDLNGFPAGTKVVVADVSASAGPVGTPTADRHGDADGRPTETATPEPTATPKPKDTSPRGRIG